VKKKETYDKQLKKNQRKIMKSFENWLKKFVVETQDSRKAIMLSQSVNLVVNDTQL